MNERIKRGAAAATVLGALGLTATGSAASPRECSALSSGSFSIDHVTRFDIKNNQDPEITVYTADGKCYKAPLTQR